MKRKTDKGSCEKRIRMVEHGVKHCNDYTVQSVILAVHREYLNEEIEAEFGDLDFFEGYVREYVNNIAWEQELISHGR